MWFTAKHSIRKSSVVQVTLITNHHYTLYSHSHSKISQENIWLSAFCTDFLFNYCFFAHQTSHKETDFSTFRQRASLRTNFTHLPFSVSNLFSLSTASTQGVAHERAAYKRELISRFLKHAAFIFTICSCTSPAPPVTCACMHACVCVLELKLRRNVRTYDGEKRKRPLLFSREELYFHIFSGLHNICSLDAKKKTRRATKTTKQHLQC